MPSPTATGAARTRGKVDGMRRTAQFSPCRTWRYTLERYWGDGPFVTFVLLNPSTADEKQDDPTNRRGIGYARRWGYDGCVFVNLFAVRTPKPSAMKNAIDPIGPNNDEWIGLMCHHAGLVVAAWGNHGAHRGRDWDARKLIKPFNPKCLGVTKTGQPKHILYLRSDAELEAFGA